MKGKFELNGNWTLWNFAQK